MDQHMSTVTSHLMNKRWELRTLKLFKKTPLRLLIDTKEQIGTGKHKGMEVIPTTKESLLRFNQSLDILKKQNKTIPVPTNMEQFNRLRDYQKEDCLFLASRKYVACFNEQRTGKTPTSLVSLAVKGVKTVIIVCPASVVYQWYDEVNTWTGYTPTVIEGSAVQREWIYKQPTNALIISYDLIRGRSGNTKDLDKIIELNYECLVLDEAHRIKNHKSLQAKAMFKLRRYMSHVLLLTGTPAPNKQHEIYSLLHMLYPTVFTSYWRFIYYYFTLGLQFIRVGGQRREIKEIGEVRHDRKDELLQFLDFCSTQRKRKEVMDWLPEKDYTYVRLPLTKSQTKYINELERFFETEHIMVEGVLDRLMRVRQICLSPALLELKGTSPKQQWIKQYLKDYPDKQVLIFSQFTSWLESLSKELDIPHMITGKVSKKQRNFLKDKFQEGKIKVLLINIKAGKEGLTLGQAHTSIFTDTYPPAGDIEQAEDRGVATHKDSTSLNLEIIRLCHRDTYDELLYTLVDNNISSIGVINHYAKYLERRKTDGKTS